MVDLQMFGFPGAWEYLTSQYLIPREPGNDGAHTLAQCGQSLRVTHSGATARPMVRNIRRGRVVRCLPPLVAQTLHQQMLEELLLGRQASTFE